MVKYEKFWSLIQVGKWRAEAIQIQFYERLRRLILFSIFGYLGIFVYFTILPNIFQNFPSDLDLLTPISTVWGFIIAFAGIGIGFSNYFVQQRTKPEIVTFFGKIEYKNVRTLVTFCNIGKTTILRNISLFAVKEKKSFFNRGSLPFLDIACSATIFQGWRIMKDGGFAGVLEKHIKLALAEINHRLKNEKDKDELDLCIMAFDEEFDIREREKSICETMVAGCKLGKYSQLAEYAEKEGFPIYDRIIQVYNEDLKNLPLGGKALAKIIDEYPPDVVDIDFEIWEKLDSIEKLLKKRLKKDK